MILFSVWGTINVVVQNCPGSFCRHRSVSTWAAWSNFTKMLTQIMPYFIFHIRCLLALLGSIIVTTRRKKDNEGVVNEWKICIVLNCRLQYNKPFCVCDTLLHCLLCSLSYDHVFYAIKLLFNSIWPCPAIIDHNSTWSHYTFCKIMRNGNALIVSNHELSYITVNMAIYFKPFYR